MRVVIMQNNKVSMCSRAQQYSTAYESIDEFAQYF